MTEQEPALMDNTTRKDDQYMNLIKVIIKESRKFGDSDEKIEEQLIKNGGSWEQIRQASDEINEEYNRRTHKEFEKEVAHASALPSQTCRALGPESDEDIAMYVEDKN